MSDAYTANKCLNVCEQMGIVERIKDGSLSFRAVQ